MPLPTNLITNRRRPADAELIARLKAAKVFCFEVPASKPAKAPSSPSIERKRKKGTRTRHDLGDAFCAMWERLGDGTPYEREYRFHATRKWRFDVAFVAEKVAVELEGGIWTKGGHTRGVIYQKNCQKYNLAAIAGWRVLRFVTNDLRDSPLQVVELVRAAMEAKV